MLQYSYYQDQSTAEIEAQLRTGRQWLHRIGDEDALRRLYEPADGGPPPLILTGGRLQRPLQTWADDGSKGTWGAAGDLVLVSNTGPDVTPAALAARLGADPADLLPFDDLDPKETVIPGPPPHPHAVAVLPSVHALAGELRGGNGGG